MTEISDFAGIVLVVTSGFALAVLSTKLTERVPVPAPALFLLAATVVSDIWPGVYEAVEIETVERIAVVALVVILFNGGLDIGWRRFRASAGPILSLGVFGTFATAGLVAVLAHYALGFDWMLAGIVGAAIAPTDPAVMFSVLGRREVAGRSGTILEGEAGVNDPAGIALMLGMIELATHADASFWVVVREFAVEMSIGVALGVLGAFVLLPLLRRLRLPSEGLYPVLTLVLAGALYGVTSLAHGSGFLAVFIAGLFLGDARMPFKGELERFSGSLASLAELVVFVALGLTVDIGGLTGRVWLEGMVLALALALLARPLVVLLTLGLARLSWAERAFITWSGLKGAVPILLAALALLGNVTGAEHVYGVVFVVVLVSVVGQGTLVPFVARVLDISMRDRPSLPWELSVRLGDEPQPAQEFEVSASSRAAGRAIRDLPLGEHAWVTLVVRDGVATRPGGSLELRAGDRVLLLAEADDLEPLTRLFAGTRKSLDESPAVVPSDPSSTR
jgi:cell volume regulation protein A